MCAQVCAVMSVIAFTRTCASDAGTPRGSSAPSAKSSRARLPDFTPRGFLALLLAHSRHAEEAR